jgi:hypothetical protein
MMNFISISCSSSVLIFGQILTLHRKEKIKKLLQLTWGNVLRAVLRLFTFLLFQYKRVCVFQRGGTPAAYMLNTCVCLGGGEGGEWVP